MQVLPPAIVGAIVETKPISPDCCGDKIDTTPVGSSRLKLKWLLLTGFTLENTC